MNFKNLLVAALVLFHVSAKAQVTKMQFINNCADLSHNSFDIYIDGVLLHNDLNFRTASPFTDVFFNFGTPVNIGIAEQNSVLITDTFLNLSITPSPTNQYIMIINGIRSQTGYTPAPKISLDVYNQAKLGTNINSVEILFANGVTDAPVMDMRTMLTNMGNDVAYKGFSNYTELSANNSYIFRLTNISGSKTSHTYFADFPNLSLHSKAITVLTSGFLNPAANSNGEAFGLFYALPDGGSLFPFDTSAIAEDLARVQLIHNSPDTAMKSIDVYADGQKIISGLQYLHATEYIDAYADMNLSVKFTKAGSTDAMYTTSVMFDSGSTYSTVLYGIHDSSANYNPSPPLALASYAFAKEEGATATSASLLFMQGSTDIPSPDVKQNNGSTFITNMAYGQFSNYLTGVTSPGVGNEYFLTVDTGNSNTTMHKYILPFDNWSLGGKTATIVFSGFNDTAANSDGMRVGLWAAMPTGGALQKLPIDPPVISVAQVNAQATYITVVPNPATSVVTFVSANHITNAVVTDISGKVVMSRNGSDIQSIDISGLNTGMYIILLQADNAKTYYSKFNKL